MTHSLQQAWHTRAATAIYRSNAAFTEAGLFLGADTFLVSFTKVAVGVGLTPNEHDRLIALLIVAGRGDLADTASLHIGQALADWRKGDKALATIRLAFAKLPRLNDAEDAYRLFLAEKVLDAGLAPYDLVTELGYALERLDKQLENQNNAINHEARGRRLYYCYDGDFAAALARYRHMEKYKNTTF